MVDSKALGVGDIDWEKACEKFPFCSKGGLQRSLDQCYEGIRAQNKGTPLYKTMEPMVKNADFTKAYYQKRLDFVEAYQNMLLQNKVMSRKNKSEI